MNSALAYVVRARVGCVGVGHWAKAWPGTGPVAVAACRWGDAVKGVSPWRRVVWCLGF